MPITLNHSNINIQYSTGSNYIIETVKSDLYRRNEIINTIVRNNIQKAPVTPNTYIDSSGNIYAIESYTYTGIANTADYTRVFTNSTTCDILLVGGGGSGGGSYVGGGGGAGGYVYIPNFSLNGSYSIKVGRGGNSRSHGIVGENGQDSTFGIYTAVGGGGGASNPYPNTTVPASSGGSGGGGTTIGSSSPIRAGGSSTQIIYTSPIVSKGSAGRSSGTGPSRGGGGGGSGIAEGDTANGTSGTLNTISGNNVFYAAGGGGGNDATGVGALRYSGGSDIGGNGGNDNSGYKDGTDGTNGTGSGGGGSGGLGNSGKGGSGIVIIRYLLGTVPTTNLLTNEPTITSPIFQNLTQNITTFTYKGSWDAQTTYTINFPVDTICDILIVGGGGGGGKTDAGGGGAGGLIYIQNITLFGNYTIKVGKKGLGGNSASTIGLVGGKGENSSIIGTNSSYIAYGGGGGGYGHPSDVEPGNLGPYGSSGGLGTGDQTRESFNVNTSGQGHLGGLGTAVNGGGGGGGSGGPGVNSGNGGIGTQVNITGTNLYYAGGGGGGHNSSGTSGGLGGGGSATFNIGNNATFYGGGGGGGGGNWGNGGDGFDGVVIIKINGTILEGITHKRLNLAFDLTRYTEYQAQQKTGVGSWRIVRYLPPTSTTWYQGNYISNSAFNIPIIGKPYNYTNEWAVPFGTFDEMCFGTFGMTYWLRCLKTSVLGTYDNAARPIISSSFSSTPYSANWYNRAGTGNPEDPWISIQNWPTQNMYGENSAINTPDLIPLDGGMCVLVRDSTTSTTIPNPNTYSLNFPVPTITDINNNSNIVLQGAYDIALSTSNAVIIPKSNQYIPKPTTFTNYAVERMYPPVRNFTAATTAVSGQTYGNGTYVVTFSSTYGGGIDPWTCFNTASSGAWVDGRYTSGVFNNTSFIVAGYLGDWVKIQLPVAIRLTKFQILMRHDNLFVQGLLDRSPKDFKIYGSNDNINWVELVNKTNAIYNVSYVYEQITPEITKTYIYYGLVVNKLFGAASMLNFNEWYIYGQEVSTGSLSIRYHLLNPTLDPIGAQWTYSSNNTNVYHMGRVGIGTTNPEYQLDVRGNIFSSTGGYTSSTLTKWSVLSDRRIKENIVKASYDKCLENVKNIELYNFNFKDNCVNTNDRHQLGFIAQEVQQVYPKAVEVGKMIVNLEQKIDDLLTLNITQIDYTLYGAVKSLIEKIENIKIKMEHIKTTYEIP